MSNSDDFCRGFDSGHKAGFKHGFIAAQAEFEKMAFELNRQISHYSDEKIDDVFLDWFGKSEPVQATEPAEEVEA